MITTVISIILLALILGIFLESSKLNSLPDTGGKFEVEEQSIIPVVGDKNMLAVAVTLSDESTPPFAISELDEALFTDTNSVAAYYEENSFNQLHLSGEVAGWYVSSANAANCEHNDIITEVEQMLIADGYTPAEYDTVLYYVYTTGNCYGGHAELGGRIIWYGDYSSVVYEDAKAQIAHEYGHILGVDHANIIDCNAEAIAFYDSCSVVSYQDFYSLMGLAYDLFHFNSVHKYYLGWFRQNEIVALDLPSRPVTHVTQLHAVEGTERDKPMLIKIPKQDSGEYYYLSYKTATGFDVSLPTSELNGVKIIIGSDNPSTPTYRLDSTPNSQPEGHDFTDSILKAGGIFEDRINRIRIKLLAINNNHAEIEIEFYAAESNYISDLKPELVNTISSVEHKTFIINDMYYLFMLKDDVLAFSKAEINADAKLVNWTQLSTTNLPGNLNRFSMVNYANYFYIIGGDIAGVTQNAIHRCQILANGDLSSWSQVASLPIPGQSLYVIEQNGTLYTLGGITNGDHTLETYSANLNAEGNLAQWRSQPDLPAVSIFSSVAAHNKYIYLIGGSTQLGQPVKTIIRAKLLTDNSLSNWETLPPLPTALALHSVLYTDIYGSRLATVGGMNKSAMGTNNNYAIFFANLDDVTGDITNWQIDDSFLNSGNVLESIAANTTNYYLLSRKIQGITIERAEKDIAAGTGYSTTRILPSTPIKQVSNTGLADIGFTIENISSTQKQINGCSLIARRELDSTNNSNTAITFVSGYATVNGIPNQMVYIPPTSGNNWSVTFTNPLFATSNSQLALNFSVQTISTLGPIEDLILELNCEIMSDDQFSKARLGSEMVASRHSILQIRGSIVLPTPSPTATPTPTATPMPPYRLLTDATTFSGAQTKIDFSSVSCCKIISNHYSSQGVNFTNQIITGFITYQANRFITHISIPPKNPGAPNGFSGTEITFTQPQQRVLVKAQAGSPITSLPRPNKPLRVQVLDANNTVLFETITSTCPNGGNQCLLKAIGVESQYRNIKKIRFIILTNYSFSLDDLWFE